ncbi:hypothetical protein C2E21_1530 [Chlorella sorokiniana]|uniref:Uncharacterized protein n=1 Tax=Chlorella sorokiniana TaxID=3076 RepID=A0A2P6U116_CHLSO|nr:hypothetical protein C2E21_1530 [Chlorella sorokiniana]|eukprot:PRW60003.1 hypothetical protein C2E21_1530 [Chlorella sorokiniana]
MPDGSSRDIVSRSGGSLAAGRLSAPLRYPRLTVTLLLWVLGLYLAFLARPAAITPEQELAFKAKIKEAEGVLGELALAERAYMEADLEMRQHMVWFWRWKPEARAAVEERRPAVEAAQRALQAVEQRRDGLLREAKAALGLWSEAGVEEGRELFKDSFAAGKLFAQRQSFWDAFFIVMSRREGDWLGLLLRLLLQTLVNFFSGMVVAVFVFLFRLPSLIWSYSPTLWSGLAFFSLAAVAGISVVASYLGLLFGAGAAAAYSTLWIATMQPRLEGRGAPRRIADGSREHEE